MEQIIKAGGGGGGSFVPTTFEIGADSSEIVFSGTGDPAIGEFTGVGFGIDVGPTLSPKLFFLADTGSALAPDLATFTHDNSAGVASSSGVGASLLFRAMDALDNLEDVMRFSGILTTTTDGAETSAALVYTRTAGAALAEAARFTTALATLPAISTGGTFTAFGASSLSTLACAPSPRTGGSVFVASFTAPNDLQQTLSVNAPDVLYTGATKQFATGALALFTAVNLASGTIAFVAASTATLTAGLKVTAVLKGTNATVTRAVAALFETVGTEGTAMNQIALNLAATQSNSTLRSAASLLANGTEVGGMGVWKDSGANHYAALYSTSGTVLGCFTTNVVAFANFWPTTSNSLSCGLSGQDWAKVWARKIAATTTSGLTVEETAGLLGLYGVTPVVQGAVEATLTNSITAGGTDNTLTNWTDLTVYATDAAAIRNAVYQCGRKINLLEAKLKLLGAVKT